MAIDMKEIKEIREETGAGVLEIKELLEEFEDRKEVLRELAKRAYGKASKKADRETGDGLVYSYIHNGGKVGSMVLVACETDFVAKTDDFKKLCNEVAMQICTEDFNDVKELLESDYIRDPSKTILHLVNEATAKLGEKIEIKDFYKLSV